LETPKCWKALQLFLIFLLLVAAARMAVAERAAAAANAIADTIDDVLETIKVRVWGVQVGSEYKVP
jgi:F0F1-type ATP synthase gamma subunit